MSPLVLPSLMTADMLDLRAQLDGLLDAGATAFHVDVMDAHFVPNLTLGTEFIRQVGAHVGQRGASLDVHLMVERPGPIVERVASFAGRLSVHWEADPHPHRLLGLIRELGCRAGLALNPATPVAVVDAIAPMLDFVNCMGVNPGFSGQTFIPETFARVRALRERLEGAVEIEVDGGVSDENVAPLAAAGASLLVSANAIFGSPDPVGAYRRLVALVS